MSIPLKQPFRSDEGFAFHTVACKDLSEKLCHYVVRLPCYESEGDGYAEINEAVQLLDDELHAQHERVSSLEHALTVLTDRIAAMEERS